MISNIVFLFIWILYGFAITHLPHKRVAIIKNAISKQCNKYLDQIVYFVSCSEIILPIFLLNLIKLDYCLKILDCC